MVEDKARWHSAPDEFLHPFIRFAAARIATRNNNNVCADPTSSPDVPFDFAFDEDADDDQEVAAQTVQMIVAFAAYVESAEQRGVLPQAVDLDVIRPLYALNFMSMFPRRRGKDQCPVLFSQLQNTANVSEEAMERMTCWFFLHGSLDPSFAIPGVCVVYDLRGMRLADAYRLIQMNVSRLAPTGCFPIRVQRMIVVNQPWWVSAFWGIASRLLDPKMRRRVTFAGSDLAYVRKFVDPEVLSHALGKSGSSAVRDQWLQECVHRGSILQSLQPRQEAESLLHFRTVNVWV